MFVSYRFVKYVIYDQETKLHSWECEITDSEFGTIVVPFKSVGTGEWARVGAMIEVYEERNLPVVPNFMKAILFAHKKYAQWPITEIVYYNKQYNPKYAKYAKDVEKYLALL